MAGHEMEKEMEDGGRGRKRLRGWGEAEMHIESDGTVG